MHQRKLKMVRAFLCALLVAHSAFPAHVWANGRVLRQDNFLVEWVSEKKIPLRDWDEISRELSDSILEKLSQQAVMLPAAEHQSRWFLLEQELIGEKGQFKALPLNAFSLELINARKAYFALQMPQCLAALAKAKGHWPLQSVPNFFSSALPFHFFITQGVCELASGHVKEADAAFQKAIALRPKEYLSEMVFSPKIIDVYEASRSAFLEKNPFKDQGSISLTSSPPFADVYLNGEYLGQTPMTFSELYPGRHYLEVRQSRYAIWYSHFEIQAQANLRLNAALKPLAWSSIGQGGNHSEKPQPLQWVSVLAHPSENLEELKNLALALGVGQLTLFQLHPQGIDYSVSFQVYDRQKNGFVFDQVFELTPTEKGYTDTVEKILEALGVNEPPVLLETENPPEFSVPESAVFSPDDKRQAEETHLLARLPEAQLPATETREQSLGESLEKRLIFESVETPRISQVPEQEWGNQLQGVSRPFHKKWWFWTLVATVAVGAGVGAAFAFGQSGDSDGSFPGGNGNGSGFDGVIVGQRR